MKILVISTPIFKVPCAGYAGLEEIAYHTAKELAKNKNNQVSLVAPQGSTCPNATVLNIGPEQKIDEYRAFEAYKPYLNQFDVIIDHSWQKWVLNHKLTTGFKTPCLNVVHAPVDTMYSTLPEVKNPCWVTISNDQKTHFENHFHKYHVKAKTAYNGIDVDFYKKLDIPCSGRFLFLARFSTIKGADIAIKACKEAGVGLDLVGDTSITNEPDYLKQCMAIADGKQIKIHGGVSRGETVWWYSQALAMLHPNKRFREPFGLAPVEANACGLPVIAWDYGAMRETMCGSSYNTLVTSEKELVKSILNIPKEKQDLEISTNFTTTAMGFRYQCLCEQAVKTGGW